MKSAITLFHIRKIGISIHWSFPLLMALILIIMALQRETLSSTLWALLGIIAVFSCVVLHELGHAFIAAQYGIHTKSIMLLPIGGMANMERIPEQPIQEIRISIAGPLVNIVIAAMLLPFIAHYVPFWKYWTSFTNLDGNNFLLYLHTVNILLAIFNLIPAFPMDGGRILRGILALGTSYPRATAIAAFTGRIIAVLFIIVGLVSFNLLLPLIGFFIMVSGKAEETTAYLRYHAAGLLVRDIATTHFITLPGGLPLQTAADVLLRNANPCFVVTEDYMPPAVVMRNDLLQAIAKGHRSNPLRSIVSSNKTILQSDAPVIDVMEQLLVNPSQIFPVLKGDHLLGVVSINNLTEYSLVHEQQTDTPISHEGGWPIIS